jgi:hypothetical protein
MLIRMSIRSSTVAYKLVSSSFVIPYGSGSAKANSYGSYGSGSATLRGTAIPILENDKNFVYLETVRHHRLELQAGCIICGGCELEGGMVVLLLLLQLGQRGQRGIHAHHALRHL